MGITLLLRCNDREATRGFYRDVLGFATSDSAEGTLTATRFGGTLVFTQADLWNGAPSFTGTVYFGVPAIDDLHAQLARSATIAWGPETMPYGSREFAVADCNGYLLAFREAG